MKIKNFNLEDISKFETYFILENVGKDSDNIEIKLKTPSGETDFEDCSLYRLNDGKVLCCFKSIIHHFSKYNLIAYSGLKKEIINLQFFERIKNYYNQDTDRDYGVFEFIDSTPVTGLEGDWRCDLDLYGPREFIKEGTQYSPIVKRLDDIIIYEPIFSVNSVGHLIYVEIEDIDTADGFVSGDEFPRGTRTLQECLKLITEWSETHGEPFGNKEKIARRSSRFISDLDFKKEFLSHIKETQTDMQIARYLKGDPSARFRPSDVNNMTPEIDEFVKKNVSHMSLSHLFSIFPNSVSDSDFQKAIEVDKYKVLRLNREFLEPFSELNFGIDLIRTSNKLDFFEKVFKTDFVMHASVITRIEATACFTDVLEENGIL
jgi:hypothetical protein